MSEEKVEIIRRGIEAYNRQGIEGVIEFAHPDGVIYPFREWPTESIYRGREGWRNLLGEWIETFDDFKWETDQLIDGDDRVIALLRIRAKVKGTQIPISQPVGAVFTDFRDDGTVAEARFYLTFQEALEAAGLSE